MGYVAAGVQLSPGIRDLAKRSRFPRECGATNEDVIFIWNVDRRVGQVTAGDPDDQLLDASHASTRRGKVTRIDPLCKHSDIWWTDTIGSVWKISETCRSKCNLCLEHRFQHSQPTGHTNRR